MKAARAMPAKKCSRFKRCGHKAMSSRAKFCLSCFKENAAGKASLGGGNKQAKGVIGNIGNKQAKGVIGHAGNKQAKGVIGNAGNKQAKGVIGHAGKKQAKGVICNAGNAYYHYAGLDK